MRVWIDILHTPQFNFYKNFISRLAERGDEVFVTVLGRGKLPVIAKKELADLRNVKVDVVGKHRMTKFSAIIEANLLRFVLLYGWAKKHKIDIVFSNGHQCCFIAKLMGVYAYSFGDDPQSIDSKLKYKLGLNGFFCIYKWPDNVQLKKFFPVLSTLKEWAYLNTRDFKPEVAALEEYGLKPYSYLFLREVSVGTVNYAGQAPDSILQIATEVPASVPVVLSLEKKENRNLYPCNWILLQEPVKDIHSLIYYSCGLVSSGDSMAREAALLGVPSYYLGIRYDMPANIAASEVADFSNRNTIPISQWLKKVENNKDQAAHNQTVLRNEIDSKFIDINEFMLQLVEKHRK